MDEYEDPFERAKDLRRVQEAAEAEVPDVIVTVAAAVGAAKFEEHLKRMAEKTETPPSANGACTNRMYPSCTGTYLLYTEGEMTGLLECTCCGYTPNGEEHLKES